MLYLCSCAANKYRIQDMLGIACTPKAVKVPKGSAHWIGGPSVGFVFMISTSACFSTYVYICSIYTFSDTAWALCISLSQFIPSKHILRPCTQAAVCMFDFHVLAVTAGWSNSYGAAAAPTLFESVGVTLVSTHSSSKPEDSLACSLSWCQQYSYKFPYFLSGFHTSSLAHVKECALTLPTMAIFCHWKQMFIWHTATLVTQKYHWYRHRLIMSKRLCFQVLHSVTNDNSIFLVSCCFMVVHSAWVLQAVE